MFVHSFFALLFYLYSINFASDAKAYFEAPLATNDWFSLFGMGAFFMKFITYPLVKLQFSYFNINLIFSLISLFGFYNLYYLLIKNAHSDNSKIHWGANALFLLPTFHFNTAGISKDNIIFYCITTLLIYIYINKKFDYKFLFILILIFFVRSYLLIFLLTAFIIYILLFSKINVITRLSIILFGISALIFMEPIISSKLRIDIFSIESVNRFIERLQSFGTNSRLGGSIFDASDMSIIQRMLAFSYLPLIWESNSVLKHITSLENFLLLIVFIKFLFTNGKYKLLTKGQTVVKLSIVYALLTWFILSFTLYNLGLSTRHKYMYIPYLYFAIFVHLKNRNDKRTARKLSL